MSENDNLYTDSSDATNGQNGTADHSSTDSAESTQTRVSDLESQLKEKEARYLYLYADFENSKKRMQKERSELVKFGWESVARDLLQVVDNLERAVTHAPANTDKTLMDGLKMVVSQFKSTLQKQGVETISALQTAFNPDLHEAISQEPSEHPEGTVVKEHMPGYTLHGRLLRPSRVTVSGGK
jgi:molecular chaperone GrpE